MSPSSLESRVLIARANGRHCAVYVLCVGTLQAYAPSTLAVPPSASLQSTDSGDSVVSAACAAPEQTAESPEAAPNSEEASTPSVTVRGARPLPGAAPKARYVSGWVATGERLESPGLDTADVLRDAPGVQVTQVGGFGAPATASLRGATAAQTPVYLAGIRLNDEVGGAANLAEVPLFLIERVEVYRSHAPLVADRMGIGGAVFFEPKRPTADELGGGAMAGSYGSRAGFAYVTSADEDGAVLAGFQLSGAENDYAFADDRGTLFRRSDDTPGRLENADAHAQNVWLSARRAVGRAWVTLVYNHADREQGAPKLASVPSRSARIDFGRDLLGLSTVVPLEFGSGLHSIEARTAIVSSETRIDDPLSELGLLSTGTKSPGQRVEQSVGARQRFGRLSLVEQVSASVERLQRYRTSDNLSELELSARRSFLRAAVGAEHGLSERVFVDASGALECLATATGSLGVCETLATTGRLGASLRERSYELYANAGRYHRAPTLSELYGASLLVRGNAGLVPEVGASAEFGGRWQKLAVDQRRLLWLDLAAFGRETRDLLTHVRAAQGHMHPVNRDRARTLGVEAAAGSAPLDWLDVEATASLTDPRDTSPDRETTNDVLPFVSRFVGSARLSLVLRMERSFLDRATLTVHGIHQSSRYADPAGLGVIPAQDTLDVELDSRMLGERLRAAVRVSNVLDTGRFDVVGYPLPGRSGFVSLEARL